MVNDTYRIEGNWKLNFNVVNSSCRQFEEAGAVGRYKVIAELGLS